MPDPVDLRPTTLQLPATRLGPENPLPAFRALNELPSLERVDELPAEMAEGVRYGRLSSPLPCAVQDGYTRRRTDSQLPAVLLDNGVLRAAVLPALGGRLWSLTDRRTGRELLHTPPSITLANLALRNAWFAGGVEWNLGSTGHSTLTCAPLHAARVPTDDGAAVLRLWEWERTRDLVYQVDLRLPAGAAWLQVSVRIRNPGAAETPLYWWSNIAVPQRAGLRVVVPAGHAYRSGYTGHLERGPVPSWDGSDDWDVTRPDRAPRAADYFFDLADGQRRWIAALDADGTGLAHASTAVLRGRKLFCWGTAAGGRRWQDWLGGADEPYAEIQAGLARTQLEHLRLPGGAEMSWTEFYAPVAADAVAVHGPDWDAARAAVEAVLPAAGDVDAAHQRWRAEIADREPDGCWWTGSGWGHLEMRSRDLAGAALAGTPFPALEQDDGAPFAALLDTGHLPDADPAAAPPVPPVSPRWAARYESAPPSWLTWLYRGVARRYAGDVDGARAAWRASLRVTPSAWALRNLACLVADDGDASGAAAGLLAAVHLAPDCAALVVEAGDALLRGGRPGDALDLLDAAPSDLPHHGRLVLQRVRALVALDRPDAARQLLDEGFEVDDIREGSAALTEAWRAVAGDEPVPAHLDFRMA